jgi:hypothetical protein
VPRCTGGNRPATQPSCWHAAPARAGDGGTLPLDAPIAVKGAALPFGRFRNAAGEGVDTVLGPEMRSTGEVMGVDEVFGTAYAKSQAAAYGSLPVKGRAFAGQTASRRSWSGSRPDR